MRIKIKQNGRGRDEEPNQGNKTKKDKKKDAKTKSMKQDRRKILKQNRERREVRQRVNTTFKKVRFHDTSNETRYDYVERRGGAGGAITITGKEERREESRLSICR